MSHIVAYYRVSSKAQDIGMQRAAVERAAHARGDSIVETYEERMSGKSTDRPKLAKLRQDAREGKIRRLYLYRLDRLTRSGIRDTFEVVEELRTSGCEVVTVADGFSLDGPASEVIMAVMAWSAKMERLAINERIAGARAKMEAEGRSWGRPSSMDATMLERARLMRSQGATVRAIEAALGVSKSAVSRALAAK